MASLVLTALLALAASARGSPSCADVSESMRFDCHPEANPNEADCEARGCCWIADRSTTAKMGLPSCFYPSDFGYTATDMHATATGMSGTLKLTGKGGPYGGDVKTLTLDVHEETPFRLHVKIYDPSEKRYEVPLETPQVSTKTATRNYTFSYTESPFGFSVKRYHRALELTLFNSTLGGFIFEDQFIQMSAAVHSFNLYGLGEHVAPLKLDMNWQILSLFSRDRGTPTGLQHNLYGVHPFYLNLEGDGDAHGVLLLNSNPMDIILQPTPAITYRTIGGILDFYFFLGPTPDDVIQQYTEVVGRPYMPPYWGLGFHLCRWGYGSANATAEVVANMKKAGIPQDVQWNDIDYMQSHLDFTYDSDKFAGLPEFVSNLHDNGMHYIMITDPGISNSQPSGNYPPYDQGLKMDIFIKDSDGKPIVGTVWPGKTVFPDFFHPQGPAYWEQQVKAFHDKVAFDGLWIDMNEVSNAVSGSVNGCPNNSLENPPYKPAIDGDKLYARTLCMSAKNAISTQYNLHSMYGYSEAKASMAALKAVLGKRSMVISRSTFPGSGVHGGHWLGDNHSEWPDLYLSIPGLLAFNLFGIPMVGADICGFGGTTNPELCARWMEVGAFYPFSRNHNSIGSKPQDPPSLGPEVVASSKAALTTRYRLLPYLYTLFHTAHVTGSTVARPLFFEFPTVTETFGIDRQFMWGPGLMISPVLEEGATTVTAFFPQAQWYDFYTGAVVNGADKNVTLHAPLGHINLHVRGGNVIVTQEPNLTTTESRKNLFGLIVAIGMEGDAVGTLFWDDGESLDTYEKGQFSEVKYTHGYFQTKDHDGGQLTGTVEKLGYSGLEDLRLETVTFYGVDHRGPGQVTVNGKSVPFSSNSSTWSLMVSNLNLPMAQNFTIQWICTG